MGTASSVVRLTRQTFHEAIHHSIDKPVKNYRMRWDPHRRRHKKVHTGAHLSDWAEATINLQSYHISIDVFLNFKRNSLKNTEYNKLKKLACDGIRQYWSRTITVNGKVFNVIVTAKHRTGGAIPVDLYIETDPNIYARSMNPHILGIDASFVYNQGMLNASEADDDFKLVAAHEFGHSILMYAGGISLSWGHKGTTNPLLQSIKSSTPGFPSSGKIDLMKYYDWSKGRVTFRRRISDSVAMEEDIKRLIWGAKISWIQ